jgi:hypothetical protein
MRALSAVLAPLVAARSLGPTILGLLDLVRRPRLIERLLKLVERVGADRSSLSANHYKAKRPIE